jgi:hypothetical protein
MTKDIEKLALDYDAYREMAAEAEKMKKALSTKIKHALKEMGVLNLETAMASLGINVYESPVIDKNLLNSEFPEIARIVTKVNTIERLDVRIKKV